MGMKSIGKGNDSEGSNLIIDLADENDDRPIWITVWGGGNTFAQSVWCVQQERSPEELKTFYANFAFIQLPTRIVHGREVTQ